MKAVTAHHLVKHFGDKNGVVKAVQDVSFEVERGALFGIIGPDGAGKTTLFHMLTTLLLPDEGEATVDGLDVVKHFRAIRNRVGYMPGHFSLYHDLTVEENLQFFAAIFRTTIKENYELIRDIYLQIEPFKYRAAGKLSGGMKQKLALCCALIHRPVVLFLDEPTTGVDAVSRKEFWEMLQNLKQKGISILVSTPYMDEAALCDRVALMEEGRILSVDTPNGVVAQFIKPVYAAKSNHMLQLLNELASLKEVKDVYPFGEYHHVIFHNTDDAEKVKEKYRDSAVVLQEIKPDIEDCFIDLMKKNG